MTNKKDLSERDICTKFITPALKQAGWGVEKQITDQENNQIPFYPSYQPPEIIQGGKQQYLQALT